MDAAKREELLRKYAACEITWHSLRQRGFDNYLDVLSGLGALGLRPPIAPMDGPNVEIRHRARALIREALAASAEAGRDQEPIKAP